MTTIQRRFLFQTAVLLCCLGCTCGSLGQEDPQEFSKTGNENVERPFPGLAKSQGESVAESKGTSQEPLPWVEGSTTLAILPDTEVYCQKRPELFEAQTKWIADNARARNIAYVLHLGDIVHDDVEPQWKVAKRCFHTLDGKVPYALGE
jgi:hypothetical protein